MKPKKFIDGILVDLTEEEAAMIEGARMMMEANEKHRPMSQAEAVDTLLKAQINLVDIPDQTSLRMKDYYPEFGELDGKTVGKGFKLTHNGELWKVRQEHTVQSIYPPSTDTAALYERINEQYDGTLYDPIPYSGDMAVEKDKYYIFAGIKYRCTRDSEVPLYAEPSLLIDNYFEVV